MTHTPRFTITRVFAAPRDRVWKAWTDPKALVQWFGPKGASSTLLSFDLRVGGAWHSRMDALDGGAMYGLFVFREVVPLSRLVWVHGFSDARGNRIRAPFAEQFPLELLTTVTFDDEGAGTRLNLSWLPLGATAEEEAFFANMMESMNGGWSGSFDQLDEFLAGC